MIDVSCGDYEWLQRVNKDGVKYVGADIAKDLIDENNEKFGQESIQFLPLNLIENDMPKGDLVFVRDCLVHLSCAVIRCTVSNIKESGSMYLLTDRKIKI